MGFTQDERRISIDTPLGVDVLLLASVEGTETMSSLFGYRVRMISEGPSVSANDIVGENVTISLLDTDDKPRYLNGYIRSFSNQGTGDRATVYSAEVVPWLWFLKRRSNCRIFQDKTVPQIVEEVFRSLGFNDYDLSGLQSTYPKLDYCAQYSESDFDFVSRLMELEGIFYYFRHDKSKHTMMLADHAGAYSECKDSEIRFAGPTSFEDIDDDLTAWEHKYEFRSGKVACADFNFKTPGSPVQSSQRTLMRIPRSSDFELFEHPGICENRGMADDRVLVRMGEEEVTHDVVVGSSTCRSFNPGYTFTIVDHCQDGEQGKSYVITSVCHRVAAGDYVTGGSEPEGYSNDFECIPANVVFRPARVTPKSIVSGPQTAIVVGPGGDEIYTDEYGRVKVQFHWDRYGKSDERSSCWIRVSQAWAGKGWGGMSIPRIGQEVIVDFLEGDPDRPIITGRVYNADQTVPYALPAEKTKTTMKTRSSTGGGGANFNEVRFEDKKDKEELYFHAEKDQTIVVENDRDEGVGRDRSLNVGRDKSEDVAKNKLIKVGANHTETVAADMSVVVGGSLVENVSVNYAETVGAAMQLTVGGALTTSVGLAMAETVGGVKSETVGASKSEAIGANKSLTTGGNLSETIGGKKNVTVAKDYEAKVQGKHRESVTKEYLLEAKKIQLTATDQITLKTGKAEIIMKKNGDITIKGKKISIKGSGDVVIKGSKIKEN